MVLPYIDIALGIALPSPAAFDGIALEDRLCSLCHAYPIRTERGRMEEGGREGGRCQGVRVEARG
jgi:hypothetical protein